MFDAKPTRDLIAGWGIPLLGLGFFILLVSAISFDLVSGEEKLALVFVLCAYLGGVGIAIIAARRGRGVDVPDHQSLSRHPGWFRYGAVGGAGGFIGLVGFIAAALIKAPVFAPVFLVLLILGAVGAVLLHSRRARQVPPHSGSLGLRDRPKA